MRKVTAGIAVALTVLAVLAWAPWLPAKAAARRTEEAFTAAWQGVADGCGLNCRGCGVRSIRRLPLGYTVRVEYACGLLPEDTPAYHRSAAVYVSPLGTVHSLPQP